MFRISVLNPTAFVLVALKTLTVGSRNAVIGHFCHCTKIISHFSARKPKLLPFIGECSEPYRAQQLCSKIHSGTACTLSEL